MGEMALTEKTVMTEKMEKTVIMALMGKMEGMVKTAHPMS
jgi:hypothetical protein